MRVDISDGLYRCCDCGQHINPPLTVLPDGFIRIEMWHIYRCPGFKPTYKVIKAE